MLYMLTRNPDANNVELAYQHPLTCILHGNDKPHHQVTVNRYLQIIITINHFSFSLLHELICLLAIFLIFWSVFHFKSVAMYINYIYYHFQVHVPRQERELSSTSHFYKFTYVSEYRRLVHSLILTPFDHFLLCGPKYFGF